MKNILLLGLMLVGLSAYSQESTNKSIIIRVTVENRAGVTNQSAVRFDGNGSKRDALAVQAADAWIAEQLKYERPGSTNTMDVQLKDKIKAQYEVEALALNAAQQAVLLAKLAEILNTQPELLSASEKTQLANIAAKLP